MKTPDTPASRPLHRKSLKFQLPFASLLSFLLPTLLLRHLGDQFSFLHRGAQVVQHEQFHVLLSFICHRSDVREQEDLRVLQESLFDLGLVLVHVQACGADLCDA